MRRVRIGILALVACVGVGCHERPLTDDEMGGTGRVDSGTSDLTGGAGGNGGGAGASGGAAGGSDGGRGGGAGVGGAGGRPFWPGPNCHPTLAVGDPCVAGETPCWAGVCSACGFELWMWIPMQVFCSCAPGPNADVPAGVWTCQSPIGSHVIIDCHLGDEPLDCRTAETLFSDAACTQHPPCTAE